MGSPTTRSRVYIILVLEQLILRHAVINFEKFVADMVSDFDMPTDLHWNLDYVDDLHWNLDFNMLNPQTCHPTIYSKARLAAAQSASGCQEDHGGQDAENYEVTWLKKNT